MNVKQKNLMNKLGLSVGFFCGIVILTRIALELGTIANATTVGFAFLVLVVISSIFGGLVVASITSVIATLFFNYFFFPPVGTFRIADFHNWVALFSFLFTAIVISRLTASAHQKAREAEDLDSTIEGLKEFGSWILSMPRDEITLTTMAESAVRIFSLQYCSIHVYTEGKWHHFSGAAASDTYIKITDSLKLAEDHVTDLMELVDEQGLGVRYTRILREDKPVALLAVKSSYLPAAAMATMSSMIGVLLVEILSESRPFALDITR